MRVVRLRTAAAVAWLGAKRRRHGHYHRAFVLQRLALRLAETELPADDHRLVPFLNELGLVCKFTGRFELGERVYRRALGIAESSAICGANATATLLHNLGGLAHARGRAGEGEPHARRGLALREALVGGDDPAVAADLAALAALVAAGDRLDGAEEL